MRILTAISLSSPQDLPKAYSALYTAFFVDRNMAAVQGPAGCGPVLAEALGKEAAEKAIKQSTEDKVKKRL